MPDKCDEMKEQKLAIFLKEWSSIIEKIKLSNITLDKILDVYASHSESQIAVYQIKNKEILSETISLIKLIDEYLLNISGTSDFLDELNKLRSELLQCQILQRQLSLNLKRNEHAIKSGTR